MAAARRRLRPTCRAAAEPDTLRATTTARQRGNRSIASRRQRHGGQHDDKPDGHHRADRGRVDQVLDRQRRHRVARGEVVPREKDLGRLAGQHAERRHAADGVAGEERAEARPKLRLAPGGMHSRQHGGADREAQPRERQNGRETPADALDAVEDVGDTGSPDDLGEERRGRRACRRR